MHQLEIKVLDYLNHFTIEINFENFDVVYFPCNYITHVKFNTNLLHKPFQLLIKAPTCGIYKLLH